MNLRELLHDIGVGQKGARVLTPEEARQVALWILRGEATDAQTGAFFALLRFRGETPEELAAFAGVLRELGQPPAAASGPCLVIGHPYDGRLRTAWVTPAAAAIAAACGLRIFLHGERGMPPKRGLSLEEVLEALGIPVELEPGEAAAALEEAGVVYVRGSALCPPLARVKRLREEFGMRNFLSVVEKLVNWPQAEHLIAGAFHGPYAAILPAVLRLVGERRAAVIMGPEGHAELSTSRYTRVLEVSMDAGGAPEHAAGESEAPGADASAAGEGKAPGSASAGAPGAPYREARLDPRLAGFEPRPDVPLTGGAEGNGRILRELLEAGRGELRDAAVWNAAFWIARAGLAADLPSAAGQARRALENGEALARLRAWMNLG